MKNFKPTTETTPQTTERELTEKELLWEQNHAKISGAITDHLFEHGSMPSKAVIANATGLSRETVYKHMRTLADSPAYHDQADSFGLMAEHVLAQLLKAALAGDLSAAKAFLNTTKNFSRPSATERTGKTQNNYIQINKTIINQQIIQQLKPEQLKRIEQTIARELEEKNMVDNG